MGWRIYSAPGSVGREPGACWALPGESTLTERASRAAATQASRRDPAAPQGATLGRQGAPPRPGPRPPASSRHGGLGGPRRCLGEPRGSLGCSWREDRAGAGTTWWEVKSRVWALGWRGSRWFVCLWIGGFRSLGPWDFFFWAPGLSVLLLCLGPTALGPGLPLLTNFHAAISLLRPRGVSGKRLPVITGVRLRQRTDQSQPWA